MPDITLTSITLADPTNPTPLSTRAQEAGDGMLAAIREYAGQYNIRLPADMTVRAAQIVPKKSGTEIVRVQLGWEDPEFPPASASKNIDFILRAVESLKKIKWKDGSLEENYPSAAA